MPTGNILNTSMPITGFDFELLNESPPLTQHTHTLVPAKIATHTLVPGKIATAVNGRLIVLPVSA